MAFNGLAQYHQSLANNENKEIGEELSRLQESLRLLQQAQSYFASAGLSAFSTEQGIIQKAFDTAKKDNDFIVSCVVFCPIIVVHGLISTNFSTTNAFRSFEL